MQGQATFQNYLTIGPKRRKEVKQELEKVFFETLKHFYICAILRYVEGGSSNGYLLNDPSWNAATTTYLFDQLPYTESPYDIWDRLWNPSDLFKKLEEAVESKVSPHVTKEKTVSSECLSSYGPYIS